MLSEASLVLVTVESHIHSTPMFLREVLDITVFRKNQVVDRGQDEEAGVVAAGSRFGKLSAFVACGLWPV